VNRLPVLLLPGDVFATRRAGAVLQELERPDGPETSVNDAFRPVCRFWDRVWRPEQLPAALLGAMRVLTDPADVGAACIALPQDVQAEAWEFPEELFAERHWVIPRALPDQTLMRRAADLIRTAKRPLIVAGGGVLLGGSAALRSFAEAAGIPVAETQAGRARCPTTIRCRSGRWARPARSRPTGSPRRRTSCWGSAPAWTSRPRAAPHSAIRT
jgi:3D-(3,5/4)-trihydroxycyclohexane-1,2-dione acylhydrolase (decyclizing)